MNGGIFDGKTYDGIMKGIQGNHVALVTEGRAGHECRVADKSISEEGGKKMDKWEQLKALLTEMFCSKVEEEAKDEDIVEVEEKTDMNESPAEEEKVEVEAKDEEEPVDVEADKIRELMTKAGLDPEDDSQQKAFLSGMAIGRESMADACGSKDEAEEVKVETASDSMHDAKEHFASLYKASIDVEKIVGRIKNPMAFDSASDIYALALKKKGIKTDGIDPSAYEGMVQVLKAQTNVPKMADSVDEEDPINKRLMGIKSI
jgi:hypothetical protein